jgi:4-diphosphocytidyl-2-C-methyl-D-erythritol kinase
MLSERHQDAVMAWAPAKVNLYLEVLARRPDGYHEIASLMVAVSLFDTLELKDDPTNQINLSCDKPGLTTGPDNLVVRAAELLRRSTGCDRGATIRLRKRIPVAAGLGGGSSDAAATLVGLNSLWKLGLEERELAELAAEIGSDVAFFFSTPLAWCTGRGEKVQRVDLKRVLWFVLACPTFGISTAEVYKAVQVHDEPWSGTEILQAVRAGEPDEIGRRLHNRLQPAAMTLRPELAELESRIAGLSPAGYLQSGSGSTWFALCHDYRAACGIARELSAPTGERMSLRVFVVRSCL